MTPIAAGLATRDEELSFTTSRSGGPGGQGDGYLVGYTEGAELVIECCR